jgi:hypothetical protein
MLKKIILVAALTVASVASVGVAASKSAPRPSTPMTVTMTYPPATDCPWTNPYCY